VTLIGTHGVSDRNTAEISKAGVIANKLGIIHDSGGGLKRGHYLRQGRLRDKRQRIFTASRYGAPFFPQKFRCAFIRRRLSPVT
jgi:hypothetical protein